MERVLRSAEQPEVKEEIAEIEALFKKAFDLSGRAVFFPVRHHSPACAFHLQKTIAAYKPEAILIEGPQNANHLIDFLVSKDTEPPFCIYLSFDDTKGLLSEDKGKYRAFYPFLAYSPEYVALREGRSHGSDCRFIDLGYGEKLINTPKAAEAPSGEEEYGGDQSFLLGSFYKRLTERLGLRSFNELWEMLFEIDGVHTETEQFVKNLFFYCYYSRKNTEEETLLYEGDLVREAQMLANIREAMKQYKRVLVVTGGIHTVRLAEALSEEEEKVEIKSLKQEESPAYLMPYSYEAADMQSGYESGMLFPFFYQKVWENIQKKRKKPYEEAALRFIINTAGVVRKKQALSIADEMQSFYMARGLSELRNKKECGVFELLDAVKAAFVKGEINSYYQPALKTLTQLMTGMEMGKIDQNAGVPPIVTDFLEACRKYKIQTNTSLKKETKLDIVNNGGHREKSQFFHQMAYLGTGFCRYLQGQDQNQHGSRILLRESWEYRFAPGVQVALIANSAYGGTMKEACLALIKKELADSHMTASQVSNTLLLANRMGLSSIYTALSDKLLDIIAGDMDFLSMAGCFQNLADIKSMEKWTDLTEAPMVDNILELCISRQMTLLYSVTQTPKDKEDAVAKGVQALYRYFAEEEESSLKESFLEGMFSVHRDLSANGALAGVAGGVLLKNKQLSLDNVMEKFNTYLMGTDEAKKMSASFLKGFFQIAKDMVFVDSRLIKALDGILADTDGDLFLEILPDLRLAFTYFLPFETDRIAKDVAALYQVGAEALLYAETFDQKEMEQAAAIDKLAGEQLSKWLFGKGEDHAGQADAE